ncbi:hypothetical protein Pcinc_019166 [Petrolisthes cinctipes]|uniref:Tudor domain-containing protein n=1 Tax=Petrolisthes cinctipes TaxID=88211 RepID=A0AAE1KKS6_PETCI|nr:hypothetical protein Pcinc_019166 [Petrolisthes cinctipes]
MDGTRIKSLIIPVGGAVLLSGLAGAVYYYFNKEDEEEVNTSKSSGQRCVSTRVRVPVDVVGLVIGRQGSNIKLIQDRTNTKIDFSDEAEVDGHRSCSIHGSEYSVCLAQQLILKAVKDQPVMETREMLVPQVAVGRIIGRGGNAIRQLSHSTGAKIIVEREEDRSIPLNYPEDMKKIVLKGSSEQIEAAKAQLLQKVAEEETMRQQISASAANMSLRARTRQTNQETEANQSPVSIGSPNHESLSPGSSERFLEAFVSAVESAAHFWIQLVGPQSVELDKLVTEMTEYYSNEETRELHSLDKVKEGSMVAAKFLDDNSWYRGRVCECLEEEGKGRQVNVYYVDFGDTETVKGDSVCELRTDFLRLSFQAIECFLANIIPESAKGDEAADAFEELTYAAQWRPVMVKVVGYRQEGVGTIPCVQIVDTNGPEDVDVAEELVKRGLAEYANGTSISTSAS